VTLEELVDKEIAVVMNNLGERKIGIMDSFSDNGIVLLREGEKCFIPWRSIMDLHLRKEGEVESVHQATRGHEDRQSFAGSIFFMISLSVMSALAAFILYASFINSPNLGFPRTVASAIGGPFIIIGFFGTFTAFLMGKMKIALFMVILIFTGVLLYLIYFGFL
jgi:hypothetical protein